jgi:hypothetical protein
VMFPGINLSELLNYINKVFNEAKNQGKNIQGRGEPKGRHINTTDDELQKDASDLLQIIQYTIQNEIYSKHLNDQKLPHPYGLSPKTIFKLAQSLGISEPGYISSLFDLLIDKAYLVTHVQKNN